MDFSHIETNHDEVYEKHRMESEHAVQERGARFLQWLMARSVSRGSLPAAAADMQSAPHGAYAAPL